MATAVPSLEADSAWASARRLAAHRLPFDPSRTLQHTLLLCGLFLLNMGGNAGAAAFFLILFVMAARSTPGAFKALMLVGLGVTLNQYLVPKSILWTPTRLALSGFCAVRCIVDAFAGSQRVPVGSYFHAMVGFCAASAICSLLSGYYVTIALLKLGNFFAVTTATLLAIEAMRRRRIDMTPWVLALIGTIVAFGLASLALGQSGNFQTYRGISDAAMGTYALFNGAFLHPNSHSLVAAPAFVFLLSAMVFSTYRNRWICGAMAAVLAVFMLYSQARTSIVASIVGMAVILVYAKPARFMSGWRLRLNLSRGKLASFVAVMAIGLVIADFGTGGAVSKRFIAFANKSGKETALDTEDIIASREGKIALSWENFLKSPIYGIGFQVSTEDYFKRNATLFTAPIEKGFLYTALLEEGGVIGTAMFALFIWLYVRRLMRTRNIPGLAVFATLFAANTFEVGLFAMGGSGTFFWTFAGAATMLGDRCWEPTSVRSRASTS